MPFTHSHLRRRFAALIADCDWLKRLAAGTVLSIVLGTVVSAVADIRYSLTDLGTLGGSLTNVTAINDRGQIVGWSDTATVVSHAFLFSGTAMSDLGTLGGGISQSNAINGSGVVVGAAAIPPGNATEHAFAWADGSLSDLGTLAGGATTSAANGVNDHNLIVGVAENSQNRWRAVSYSSGAVTDLGTLGGSMSEALAVNNLGQIVGDSDTAASFGSSSHAFLYTNGVMTDLGTLGGNRSQATAINDHGWVTGWAQTGDGFNHAFLYHDGKMTDLGTLGGTTSYPSAINSGGEIVGGSYTGVGPTHAFIFSDGAMRDLNGLIDPSSGVTLTSAYGINDSGQIAVDGFSGASYVSGHGRGYLLTPLPEPSSVLALLLAGTVMLFRRRTSNRQGRNHRPESPAPSESWP